MQNYMEQLQDSLPLLFLILLAHIIFEEREMCRNKLTYVARYFAVKTIIQTNKTFKMWRSFIIELSKNKKNITIDYMNTD